MNDKTASAESSELSELVVEYRNDFMILGAPQSGLRTLQYSSKALRVNFPKKIPIVYNKSHKDNDLYKAFKIEPNLTKYLWFPFSHAKSFGSFKQFFFFSPRRRHMCDWAER